MEFILGNYSFSSVNEYSAAKRDCVKINRLEKTGRNEAEIARNYKEQIKRGRI